MKLPIRQYFALLSQYLRPQWRRVTLLGLLLFTTIGLQLVAPQIVRQFIDLIGSQTVDATLTRAGILFLVISVVQQITRVSSAYLTEDVKWRATNWLRNDLSRHTLHLDMAFHNENTPGSMIERIDGDVTELSNFFSQFVLRVLGNGLLLLGVLALLFREDWRMGLAFVIFSLAMIGTMGRMVDMAVDHFKERREASAQLFGYIEELLGGTEDVRANGGVDYAMDKLYRAIYNMFAATRKAFTYGNFMWGTANVFFGISMALSLGLGAVLFYAGEVSLGTVYLFLHYSNLLRRPLEQLSRELQDLQSATAAIDRIQELMILEPTVKEIDDPLSLPAGSLSVVFDSVDFGYNPAEPVLQGVSFHLRPGKVLGLLGRTGSGKTTITRLLFRMHDPQRGAIYLAGEDLREVKLVDVRQGVGMVTQDVQLFQATVRDNLTFFNPAIPDDEIVEALALLGLGDWFASLPDGLDTRLESGGKGLSAGEAQLLAFTRVFLKDPGLVILDEASSRLDPVTEQLIERAIDRLLHNRTAIIVAHRLATVQRADDILILHSGRILEYGDRVVLSANPDSQFSGLLRTGMEKVLV